MDTIHETDSILADLSDLIATAADLNRADIDPDAPFRERYDLDSMTVIALIMDLENRFGISLNPQRLIGLKTIRELASMVQTEINGSSSCKSRLP